MQIIDFLKYLKSGALVGLFGGAMISGNYHGRNCTVLGQTMKLLPGQRDDPVGGSNFMEYITGIETQIGRNIDYPRHRIGKAGHDIFLTAGQAAFPTVTMRRSGAKMASEKWQSFMKGI